MILDKLSIEEILGIDWFSHCGEAIALEDVEKSPNVSSAVKSIQSTRYENIVLDHSGDFTAALHRNPCTVKYMDCWNSLVQEFKEKYIPTLMTVWQSKLEPLALNQKPVLDDVSYNVVNIAVIGAYHELLPMPKFFSKMLEIYKSGYLVCGWKGKKNDGRFCAY